MRREELRHLLRNVGEDRGQVLGIGEKPDDVDVVVGDEVEPAAREADDAADPQSRAVGRPLAVGIIERASQTERDLEHVLDGIDEIGR